VKINRSWISLVGYCLITVLAAALAFAVIVAGASVALASHQSDNDAQSSSSAVQETSPPASPERPAMATFTGMITDSYCGARHMRHTNLTPAECAASCIRSGASYVLVDGDRRYRLSGDRRSLSKLLGTRASISGTLQGDTIVVNSAAPWVP